MKPETFKYICDAINAAKVISADGMIFNENGVYASDEAIKAMMIQPHDVEFEFETMAMLDVAGFIARVALFQDQPDAKVVIDQSSKAVRLVTMRAGRTKVDYQCTLPGMVQVPKKVNDTFVSEVDMDKESVDIVLKALAVMRGEEIYVTSNDSGVSIEITAVNNDVFNHLLPNTIRSDESDVRFVHKYPAKTLMQLLRKNPEAVLQFGQRGTINIEVDGFNFYILPLQ